MLTRTQVDGLREGLHDLPALSAHTTGQEVRGEQIYFPASHLEALDPNATLVVGNRGMGKSFWASALVQPQTREIISKAYSDIAPRRLEGVDVYFGFADAEGGHGSVSKEQIAAAAASVTPETVWKAVLIRTLAPLVGKAVPLRFVELARWVRDNIEEQREILRLADDGFRERGRSALFLFDQLDQLADSWDEIQRLTQGLLKVALSLKSYRHLRAKIFMRPDQAENRELFRFPDASKIYGGRVRLRWRAVELYGLLYFELLRNEASKPHFEEICRAAGIDLRRKHKRLRIPADLAWHPPAQHKIFNEIAGEFMGKSAKRGLPYTWIPVRLADGKGEVSPRTFLKAIKTAADHIPPPMYTAMNHDGIEEGVREASENRLAELQEDYPWVSDALIPLRGLLVPCSFDEVKAAWTSADTTNKILKKYHRTSAPIGLEVADLFGDVETPHALLASLEEIGVLETRPNGKVNVPDIFRIKAGILRKGGVTPQQRQAL